MSNIQPPIRTGLLDFIQKSSGSQFVIPVYQRNYTWTANKEVKQYLDDLKSVLNGEYKNHFLGIIIYIDTAIDFSTKEFSVIDGQQRLTTTFLILYAIRYIMKENKMDDAIVALDGQFLTNPFASERIKYKLKPLVADDDVYQLIINEKLENITNKNSTVYKNFVYIYKEIKKLNKEYDLNQILTALNQLYVVCIPLSEDDNAQKIFESINATGVKLTASDLIRNFLLMDMDSEIQEKFYKDYWMEIERFLGNDSKKLESFFRLFLAAKNYNLPNKNSVYNEFVKWYKKESQILNKETIFKEIIRYASFYNEVYYKDISSIDPDISKSIGEYRKTLSEMPASLIMDLYDKYDQNLISIKQLSECIYVINNYLIRRALADLDTNAITRLFPTLIKDIEIECKENYSNITSILKKNLVYKNINNSMYVPDDKQIHDLIVNSNMYKNKSALRIFLDKLEHDNNPAPVRLEKLSVEHLMPQTPTREWIEMLRTTEDDYQRNLNRLGNLTLAAKSDNSKMKNNPWEYKNDVLKSTSHLTINQKLLEKDKWNIEEIDKRTEELICEINRLFPYPETSDKFIKKEEIFIKTTKVKAAVYLYLDTGDVEILQGSELYKFDNPEKYPDVEEERDQLLEDGIIYDDGDKLIFLENYVVTSKSTYGTALTRSANLILHGFKNGWDHWRDINGEFLNKNQKLMNELL
ncbi:GmrSD restriction endonuclease domain-containing protein [Anaerococcus nagyae]|uniref:GmrSD restriction endonuclease domain-containing protein n=1 Tax=Anaerococcus nagyae TaxID=1755241 RepID=UPI001AEB8AA7|nr:DUF262 domain-containing protein [Anaerococcus nagyae]MBP2070006.1 uncharacterized protein with ParB-like and HNH nuclease domain [Anaerococcus nagyae]